MSLLDDILKYIFISLIFINACLYIWSYRKSNKPIALKYFSVYLLMGFIITFSSAVMAVKGENNLYLSHYYFVFQFILLSLFYKILFLKNQKKAVNYVLILILIALGFQYTLNPSLYYKFNLFEIFITSVPIIIYSFMHLYNSLSRKGEYMFINTGVLIYITVSTLIFILGDFLSGLDNGIFVHIWVINKFLYILYLILILIEWKKLNLQAMSKS